MTNKKKLSILTVTLAIVALLASPGINIAMADHGGDNGNRGRGNSENRIATTSVPAAVSATPAVSNSTATSSALMQNNRGRGNENENENNENENEHNNNVTALEARIQALETLVQQLSARILVLEQKVGIVDTTAPVIAGTTAVNLTATSADITWTTSEPAKSKVYFSTTTPVNLATATIVTDPSLVMNHSLHLAGLTANTTYHYIVESADGSNNISRSAELSFVTAVLDVTAPIISATTIANIAATTADISWTTNELATSKIYFSVATPVNLATATIVTDPTLVLNHSLHVAGLTANTTYHYIVESKDAANNTAISIEQSFVTTL